MRRGVVGGIGSSKPKWFPRQLRVTFCELLNLDELVLLHVRETLSRVRGRPPHFQPHNFRRFPQADVLLDGVRAERTTAADRAIYGPLPAPLVFYSRLDARPNSRAVRLDPHKSHSSPVVGVSRIFVHSELMRVSRCRAANRHQ